LKHVRFSQPLSIILALSLSLSPLSGAQPDRKSPARKQVQTLNAPANPQPPQPLSEEEQSDLARRAEEPGPEVVGGAMSNQMLTYIVIALAAAVIVLIAVH